MIVPDKSLFNNLAGLAIDRLEGGYFHPYMYRNDPQKFRLYKKSGETLFGLDRHAGHDIFYTSRRISSDPLTDVYNKRRYKYKSQAAADFWDTIDQAQASIKWKWNSRGGQDERKLKQLAINIIYDEFLKYSRQYLTEDQQKIVFSSPDLLFLFIYATWNGAGFFKTYARRLSEKMKAGTSDPADLAADQVKARQASQFTAIRQTADKISSLLNSDFFQGFKNSFASIRRNIDTLPLLAMLFFFYLISTKDERED